MPDKPVVVKIKRNPENPKKCKIEPIRFKVKQGGVVGFDAPPGTRITFVPGGPPFDEKEFTPFASDKIEPGEHAVRSTARIGLYQYDVTWPENGEDNEGNGTGEVVSR